MTDLAGFPSRCGFIGIKLENSYREGGGRRAENLLKQVPVGVPRKDVICGPVCVLEWCGSYRGQMSGRSR